MASDSKDSAFSILGSSKLNTADGKNPTSSATTSTSTQPGTASGQNTSEEYKKECSKAHDALENRLRDEGEGEEVERKVVRHKWERYRSAGS